MTAERARAVFVIAALAGSSSPATADRYEATITLRPTGALARIDDAGVETPAVVGGGGFSGGLAYGVRNWLDVGAEVVAVASTRARYDDAMLPVSGTPQTGELSRVTRMLQLRAGGTLRMGVAWVPVLHAGLGIGARQRSAAELRVQTPQGPTVIPPDDEPAELVIDLVATLRLGLDHRVSRRWTIGASVGATECVGLGAPAVQIFDASVALAYTWYPLW